MDALHHHRRHGGRFSLPHRHITSVVAIEAEKDALRIVGLTVLLVAIGFLAATLPARRASSIEPMEALREK